jgi:hypothetical protein
MRLLLVQREMSSISDSDYSSPPVSTPVPPRRPRVVFVDEPYDYEEDRRNLRRMEITGQDTFFKRYFNGLG